MFVKNSFIPTLPFCHMTKTKDLAGVGIAERVRCRKGRMTASHWRKQSTGARILLKIQFLVGREKEFENNEATRTTTMTTSRLKGVQLGWPPWALPREGTPTLTKKRVIPPLAAISRLDFILRHLLPWYQNPSCSFWPSVCMELLIIRHMTLTWCVWILVFWSFVSWRLRGVSESWCVWMGPPNSLHSRGIKERSSCHNILL